MLDTIKKYKINEGLSDKYLKSVGFRPNGWIPDVKEPKLNYTKILFEDIELHIEVSISNGKVVDFDDYKNIYVIDEKYGQPYTPFYNSEFIFPYLEKVIKRYNEEMDKLVLKGVLSNLVEEKEKSQKIKMKRGIV